MKNNSQRTDLNLVDVFNEDTHPNMRTSTQKVLLKTSGILIFCMLLINFTSAIIIDDDIGHQLTYLNGCNRILDTGDKTIVTYTRDWDVVVTDLTNENVVAPALNDHFISCIQQDDAGYIHLVYGARPDGIWYAKSRHPNSIYFNDPVFINDYLTYPILILLNDKPFLFARKGLSHYSKMQMYNLSQLYPIIPINITSYSHYYISYPTDYYTRNIIGQDIICVAYNNKNNVLSNEFYGVNPSIREYINLFCTDGEDFFDQSFQPLNIPQPSHRLNNFVSEPTSYDGDAMVLPENIIIYADNEVPIIIKNGNFIIYSTKENPDDLFWKLNDFTCSANVILSHYPSKKVMSLLCDEDFDGQVYVVPYYESLQELDYTFNTLPQSTNSVKLIGNDPYFLFEYKKNILNEWNLASLYQGDLSYLFEGSYFHPTMKNNLIYATQFNHTGIYTNANYDGIMANGKLVKIYLNNQTKEDLNIRGVHPTFSKWTNDFLFKDPDDNSLHMNLDIVEQLKEVKKNEKGNAFNIHWNFIN